MPPSDPRPTVLVDISQYVSHPVTTGVQRVLLHLLELAPGQRVHWATAFLSGGRYQVVPRSAVVELMRQSFDRDNPSVPADADERSVVLGERLAAVATGSHAVEELPRVVDAYLLPEPTMRDDLLLVCDALQRTSSLPCAFIFYDAIPATVPTDFPLGGAEPFDRYLQRLCRSEHVASISSAARRELEERLRRRPLGHGVVVQPGADGLPKMHAKAWDRPTFVVLGTLEPRKRPDIVLDAFRSLWDRGIDARAVFVGRRAQPMSHFEARLDQASLQGWAEWWPHAGDEQLAAAMIGARGVVFVSGAEGYGLPVMEALHLGCPVIVDAGVPALEGLPADGQIRLSDPDVSSVTAAIEQLLDAAWGDRLREAASSLTLPTWAGFADGIDQWLADVVTHAAP